MSCDRSKTMVGIICKDGIVLASNGKYYRYYYLDGNIHFCFLNAKHDSEILLEVFNTMDDQLRDKFHKITVDKVLKMLEKKYKSLGSMELLLAGQDETGMHLIAFRHQIECSNVNFIALGMRSEEINNFLKSKWQSNMNLKQGEELVNQAFQLGLPTSSSDIERKQIYIIFKQMVTEHDEANMDGFTDRSILSNSI